MSRGRTRSRRRRVRRQELVAEFQHSRDDPELFEAVLRQINASDVAVWGLAEAARSERPLDDAERAMIAQIVAPHLAGLTPISVRRRELQSRKH